MNRLLIAAILLISTAPLFAQAQQPDMAKLKDDAQKVVSIIKTDKAKTQTYCQMSDVDKQLDEAERENERTKVEELVQKLSEFKKGLGPEYRALFDALNDVGPNSKDVQDIVSMLDTLNDSCPH